MVMGMTNIIGLTKHGDNQRVMVNADNIAYFQTVTDDGQKTTENHADRRLSAGGE